MNADGSNVRRLTKDTMSDHPDWSPDGRRIVFDHGEGIDVMDADGSQRRTLIKDVGGGDDAAPSWSPDGRRIAFGEWHQVGKYAPGAAGFLS